MSERDPRVGPKPGDKWRKDQRIREVQDRRNTVYRPSDRSRILFYEHQVTMWSGGMRHLRSCSLGQWRKWTKTAEVIQRGEDAATGRKG